MEGKKNDVEWKLEKIARVEESKRKRTWIRYGKIRIDREWWTWDEEEEVLRDQRGLVRGVRQPGEG